MDNSTYDVSALRVYYSKVLRDLHENDSNAFRSKIFMMKSATSNYEYPETFYKIVKGSFKKPDKWFIYDSHAEINMMAIRLFCHHQLVNNDTLYTFDEPEYSDKHFTLLFVDKITYDAYLEIIMFCETIIRYIISNIVSMKRIILSVQENKIQFYNWTHNVLLLGFKYNPIPYTENTLLKVITHEIKVRDIEYFCSGPKEITICVKFLVKELDFIGHRRKIPFLEDVYKTLNPDTSKEYKLGLHEIKSDSGKSYFFNHNMLMCASGYYYKYFTTDMKVESKLSLLNSDYTLDYFQRFVYKIVVNPRNCLNWINENFDVSHIMELFHFMDYYDIKYQEFGLELLLIVNEYILEIDSPLEFLQDIGKIKVPEDWKLYKGIVSEFIKIFS